jgi:heat shock protein 1/8
LIFHTILLNYNESFCTFSIRVIYIDSSMMEDYEGQIGIDLGTTYSCVGVWSTDHVEIIPNQDGSNTTPSWVAFTDTEILVGENAKSQAIKNPENTIFDSKRLLGKRFSDDNVQEDIDTFPFAVTGDKNDIPTIHVNYKGVEKTYKPEQIAALILEKMKGIAEDFLGKRVKKAVITVPAYFNDSQRSATKNAATIAGLVCDKIINEPTAACMCYGLDKKEDNCKVLIFDLGGGTFDVSVLNLYKGVFQVLSTSGNTHLGGEDFDNMVMDHLIEEFARKNKLVQKDVKEQLSNKSSRKLKMAAECAKRTLSTSQSAPIEIDNFYDGRDFSAKLTRTKFETLCSSLFKNCLDPVRKALDDASLDPNQISEVILIGGSTRIPKIQALLSEHFGGIQLNKSVNPDEAVAYGAAVQGAILSKCDPSGKTKELLLMDVSPLSLGIESKGNVMSIIIPRNSSIPTKESKVYSTVENQQTSVDIKIFEGERKFTTENHKLGDFELTDIPCQPKGVPKIQVTLSIDANGILHVEAMDKESGNKNDIKITDSAKLSQEEINKMIDEADEFRADDEMRKDALNSRYQFEKELAFTQQSINDPDLNMADDGTNILEDDEINWLNQFILNNLTWLEDNDELDRDKIDEAKRIFTNNTKALMSRIFARKKQLDMAKRYAVEEGEIDQQQAANSAFGATTEASFKPKTALKANPTPEAAVKAKAKPKPKTALKANPTPEAAVKAKAKPKPKTALKANPTPEVAVKAKPKIKVNITPKKKIHIKLKA